MPYLVNGVIQNASLQYRMPRVLSAQTSQVGNVGSGSSNLMSFVVPANTLTTDGDTLTVWMRGVYASNPGGMAQNGLTFGGVTIFLTDVLDVSGLQPTTYYGCGVKLIRTSPTSCHVSLLGSGATAANGGIGNSFIDLLDAIFAGTGLATLEPNITVDFTTALTIQSTCVLAGITTNNTITQDYMQVILEPTN